MYYGGDSSGICAEPFTRERAHEMLDYFCRVGGEPYYGNRGSLVRLEGEPPACSYCYIPLVRNGFGGRFASFSCLGCGETLKLRDKDFDKWRTGTLDLAAFPRFNGPAQLENKELF